MSPALSFLFHVALLLHVFLPTANGLAQCINPITQPIELNDCRILYNRLSTTPWYGILVQYGPTQRPPGKLPRYFNYKTCQFTLFTHTSYMGSETIILSSYQARLAEIFSQCLNSGEGFTAGLTNVGTQSSIFVYIGGLLLAADGEKSLVNLVSENTTLSMLSAL